MAPGNENYSMKPRMTNAEIGPHTLFCATESIKPNTSSSLMQK